MDRTITSTLPPQTVIDDGDMLLFRALPTEKQESVGPFVFLDHYRHQSRRGIGDKPHPHAGIEVISYLLEGGVEHRDSHGFRDTLGPGDAQYIRAGSGMLHAEQPAGGRHGLQLWTSLPPAKKFIEPAYHSYRAADIPVVTLPNATIKVVAGQVNDVMGPMVLTSPTTFAVVHLKPGATARFDVDGEAEMGVYILDGLLAGPNGALGKGAFAMLSDDGSTIALTSASTDSETIVAVVGGEPAAQPMFFSGPFVMDSPENIRRAERDFLAGKMGTLDGVPF